MSDGFQGQFGGPEGKKFQTRQLKEIIASNSSYPLDEQMQRLNYIFESWRSDKNQLDDVTIMGVKF
jgi:serine phosphatase RsbU (regulator of sigma subunit)